MVFVGLLEIQGLRDEEIICSSVPPYCILLGNKVYEWLVSEFQNSDLHVIYVFSKDYYSSATSLNEMGATWAMKHKWTGVLLPGFQFNQLDGGIDKTQIEIKLDDSDNRTLKYRLSEFKDELIKDFNLRPMPRTKGSKNHPKTINNDYTSQISEKQETIVTLNTEIASITANINTLKADLKEKKTTLKKAEKEVATLEAKKAKAEALLKKLLASGMNADEILEKLK